MIRRMLIGSVAIAFMSVHFLYAELPAGGTRSHFGNPLNNPDSNEDQ